MKKFNVTPNETPQLLEEIQGNAGYHFKNIALLKEAFTHPSYASEQKEPTPHNQRLEFLGDAVLQIIASDYIFKTFKDSNEGLLTKIRSNITDENANVSYTRKLQLDLALLLGKGEAAAGGRSKPSTLGDLFEAFLGAVYLDGGLEEARRVCLPLFPDLNKVLNDIQSSIKNDSKGKLQNYCQEKLHTNIHYELVETSGPVHNPTFVSVAMLNGVEIGRGSAHSKKESEKNAATAALQYLLEQEGEEVIKPAAPVVQPPPAAPPKFTVGQKRLLALDFDGVICDSAAETAISGWKAAAHIWPDKFTEPLPPQDIVEKFRRIRPYLETGYQSIFMIRMLVDGEAETSFQYSLAEKFAVMMEDFKLTKEKLVHEFGAVRDAWIQSDLDSWLAPQNPYPNTIESLKSALQKHRVLILTTKQERFVKAWLGHFNVDFPQEDIIGLDRKTPKEETLAELVRANKKNIHFVEDRLKTLQRVAAIPSLKRVNLHYADWGYGTPAELHEAKSLTRIDTITLSDFYDLLS